MKTLKQLRYLAWAGLGLGAFLALVPSVAYAGSKSVTHKVTVKVPNTIYLSADTTDFTLTMSDFLKDSLSDTKTVAYTIKANKFTKSDGVLHGKLDAAYSGIDLIADPGTYSKIAGNASLREEKAGDIVIGTSDTYLADRETDNGSGKIAYGTLPVVYKAKALQDLEEQEQAKTLTVTFVDQ